MERSIRIEKDFNVLWSIRKVVDGVRQPYELEGRELVLRYRTPDGILREAKEWKAEGNIIAWTFRGKDQKTLGSYELILTENAGKDGMVTVDTCKAFKLVAHSCEETEGSGSDIVIEDVVLETEVAFAALRGPQGEQGPAGPQGPQGERGPEGPQGPAGPSYNDTEIKGKLAELSAEVSKVSEEIYGKNEMVSVVESSVVEGFGINSANGQVTNAGRADYSVAVYEIDFGKTYHIFIPKLTNAYTAAYGFLASEVPNFKTTTLPNPVVKGALSDYEADVTSPSESLTFLVLCYETAYGMPSVTTENKGEGLVAVVASIEEDVERLKDKKEDSGIDIYLPKKIYAVVGDTFELFYRSLIVASDISSIDIVPYVAKGRSYPRKFFYSPIASDVGETPLAIKVKTNGGEDVASADCIMQTADTAKSPTSAKKILCFGDSLTYGGQWVAEVNRRLTKTGGTPVGNGLSNIEFCGALNKDGAGYFGMGGWNWENYTTAGRTAYRFQVSNVSTLSVGSQYSNNGATWTIIEVNITGSSGNILAYSAVTSATPSASGTLTKTLGDGDETISFSSSAKDSSNPLWNGSKMTFVDYANAYSDGKIDCVYVLLGVNGLPINATDFTTIINNVKIFADTLHSEFPLAKLYILGIPSPSANGGLGYNYGANGIGMSNRLGLVRSEINLARAYMTLAEDESYKSFVEFVDVASQFDCEYNYPFYEFAVNTRSTIKERIDNNGLHPSDAGYYQIADVVYRHFVANHCQ